MAVMLKSLTRTNGDAGAVFRDPTGEPFGDVPFTPPTLCCETPPPR